MLKYFLHDEMATKDFGEKLAVACAQPCTLYFKGELGAGKSTLIRAYFRALGVVGAIKSPTFTLVESYEVNQQALYHLDLYRIEDPQELDCLGVEEFLDADAICCIEWPERGRGRLSEPDVLFELHHSENGRQLELTAKSRTGERILTAVQKNF